MDDVWFFLANHNVEYADRVEARLNDRAASLCHFPALGRVLQGTAVRRLSTTDIQYVIDYEVDEDDVRILRVRSTRQDWKMS